MGVSCRVVRRRRRHHRRRRRRISHVLGESGGGDPKAVESSSLLASVPPLDRTTATMTIMYVISPLFLRWKVGFCCCLIDDTDSMGWADIDC